MADYDQKRFPFTVVDGVGNASSAQGFVGEYRIYVNT